VSRARFESKLMQASTAYRMTVYRHQIIGGPIELVVSCRQVRLSPLSIFEHRKYLNLKRLSVHRHVQMGLSHSASELARTPKDWDSRKAIPNPTV